MRQVRHVVIKQGPIEDLFDGFLADSEIESENRIRIIDERDGEASLIHEPRPLTGRELTPEEVREENRRVRDVFHKYLKKDTPVQRRNIFTAFWLGIKVSRVVMLELILLQRKFAE